MVPDEAALLTHVKQLQDDNHRLNQEIWNLRNELRDCHFIQEKFSKAFYNNQALMCITRLADGVIIDFNKVFQETLGYTRDELIGWSVLEFGFWFEKEDRAAMLNQLAADGYIRNYESKGRSRSGQIAHWLCSISIFRMLGEEYLITSLVDITERKQAEAELQATKDKFYKVFNDNQAMMAIVTVDESRIMDVNNTALKTFGFKREEIVDFTLIDNGLLVDPEQREEMLALLHSHGFIDNYECTMRTKSGQVIILMCSANLMVVDGVNCLLVSAADITAHKRADEALKRSEQLLSLVINSIPLAIFIRTLSERSIVAVNDVFLSRHGLIREEVVGRTIAELGFVKDRAKMEEFFAHVQEYGLMKNFEIDIVSPRGKAFTALLSGVRIVWQGNECVLTVSNDITNLREYEKELIRLDNLNLMGQMAASIAHEVRNPMTSIKGFLQLFETDAKYSDDQEALELMIEELDRVNSIITSFLSLAQKNIIDIKLHNLNDIIKNLQPLILADTVKNDIALVVELGEVSEVMVDEGEIRQVLLNLSQNAVQAMPTGGALTIKTLADNNGVNLVVQDTGQGIPHEVMAKVGTPFITTKKDGTGLGLALCYSIAERLDAKISIDTSPAGTSFTVTFPVAS